MSHPFSNSHCRLKASMLPIASASAIMKGADAIALTRVEAMKLAQEQLNRLIESNPRVARAAISCLCRRLRDTSEQVEAIALHPVEVRLARFLLSVARAGA